jgi:hypothetical protein
MSEIDYTKALAASTIAFWSGIVAPNDAAEEIAGHFAAARDDLATLRGKARFEEEPAAFLAALMDTREGAQ